MNHTRHFYPDDSEHVWTTGIDEAAAARKAKEAETAARLEAQEQRIETLTAALELFVKQWNACGPNSDFGRYFRNVRDAAHTAIAPVQSKED